MKEYSFISFIKEKNIRTVSFGVRFTPRIFGEDKRSVGRELYNIHMKAIAWRRGSCT